MKTIERIFLIMKEKNIKDKPVYTAAQVPKNTFSGWRKSLKNPDPDTLPDIAEILGVSLEWLITGTETPTLSFSFPEDKQQLLSYYDQSNQEGKERIIEQAEFISHKYPAAMGKLSEYKIG